MLQGILPYPILQYIIDHDLAQADRSVKLPPMTELASSMQVSRGKLREDLIAAEAYGLIEMRPGDGTYVCPFDFYAAIRTLVLYATACDWNNLEHFYHLRVQIELSFWEEAVSQLTAEDKRELIDIQERAEHKLAGTPVEIPHQEHRDLHLLIYRRLENQFVRGLLTTYWDAHEAVGLHHYFDIDHYQNIWHSHRELVSAIATGALQDGRRALARHFDVLREHLQRPATE